MLKNYIFFSSIYQVCSVISQIRKDDFMNITDDMLSKINAINKEYNFVYDEFLNIKKIKKIKGLNLKKMYRDYKHIFVVNKNYYTEREIIKKRFDLQGKVW